MVNSVYTTGSAQQIVYTEQQTPVLVNSVYTTGSALTHRPADSCTG